MTNRFTRADRVSKEYNIADKIQIRHIVDPINNTVYFQAELKGNLSAQTAIDKIRLLASLSHQPKYELMGLNGHTIEYSTFLLGMEIPISINIFNGDKVIINTAKYSMDDTDGSIIQSMLAKGLLETTASLLDVEMRSPKLRSVN